jgi:glycine C-acetyltransferase
MSLYQLRNAEMLFSAVAYPERFKEMALKADFYRNLSDQIKQLKQAGLYKAERTITTQQQAAIKVDTQAGEVLNFCANNYLGLANHPALISAGKDALEQYGYGMASVRFICGTQTIHKQLEQRISHFLEMEDTILYSSCFDANGGLFETLLSEEDAIISDALNHASIIDGVRLCKAKRFRYNNNDMQDLKQKLQQTQDCRYRLIATEKGKGSPEYCNVMGRIDIITGTLGKALGGASGGYTSGRKELVEWLRNRSRPYLFSNTLAPVIAAASLTVLDLLEASDELRIRLGENSYYFRTEMTRLGFNLVAGEHPIIPVMLGDAKLATEMANRLLAEGIYVIGFSYPVVPQGLARIRVQISAAHQRQHLDKALVAFAKIGRELQVIP